MSRALLIREKTFARIFCAYLFGSFAISVLALTIVTIAIKNFGADGTETGLLRAVQLLPAVGGYLVAGVIADRFAGRRILALSAAGAVLFMGLMVVATRSPHPSLPLVVIISAGAATMASLFTICVWALIPRVVSHEDRSFANALLISAETGGLLIGPVTAGAVFQAWGGPATFGIAFAAGCVTLLAVLSLPSTTPDRRTAPREPVTFMSQFRGGWQAISGERTVRRLFIYSIFLNLGNGAVDTISIMVAFTSFGLNAAAVGALFACSAAAALFGSLVTPRIALRLGQLQTLVVFAAVGGVAWIAVPLGSHWHPVILLFVVRCVHNFSLSVRRAVQFTVRQALTSPEVEGRVAAFTYAAGTAAVPLGAIAGGLLTVFVLPPTALLIGGMACAIGAAWVWGPARRGEDPVTSRLRLGFVDDLMTAEEDRPMDLDLLRGRGASLPTNALLRYQARNRRASYSFFNYQQTRWRPSLF